MEWAMLAVTVASLLAAIYFGHKQTGRGKGASSSAAPHQTSPVHPRKPNFEYNKGRIALDAGDFKTALPHLEKALKLQQETQSDPMNPETAKYRIGLGNCYVAMNKPEKAIKQYTNAIAAFNEDDAGNAVTLTAIYTNRGVAYAENGERGDHARALKDYDKALALHKGNYTALVNRGDIRYIEGDNEEAIEDYTAAIRLKPRLPLAFCCRSAAFGRAGKYDEALADINRAFRNNSRSSEAYLSRAQILCNKPEPEPVRAIEDCNRTLKLNPRYAQAFFVRGNCYVHKGDEAAAIADFSEAIKHKPNLRQAYINRANVYARMGKRILASLDYGRAIVLAPDNGYASQIAMYTRHGKALQLQNRK